VVLNPDQFVVVDEQALVEQEAHPPGPGSFLRLDHLTDLELPSAPDPPGSIRDSAPNRNRSAHSMASCIDRT
jgi:hypothetical protein